MFDLACPFSLCTDLSVVFGGFIQLNPHFSGV